MIWEAPRMKAEISSIFDETTYWWAIQPYFTHRDPLGNCNSDSRRRRAECETQKNFEKVFRDFKLIYSDLMFLSLFFYLKNVRLCLENELFRTVINSVLPVNKYTKTCIF